MPRPCRHVSAEYYLDGGGIGVLDLSAALCLKGFN